MVIRGIGKLPGKNKYPEYEAKTPYFVNDSFKNIEDFPLMNNAKSTRSRMQVPDFPLPISQIKSIERGRTGELNFYWLGHSAIFLQMGEKNILIDPALSKYASPFSFMGVKRYSKSPIEIDDLPEIDILLISHDHYDHLDYQTIEIIKGRVKKVAVPLGVDSILLSFGVASNMIEVLSWGENITIDGINILATPARHFSTRNPLHSNATWWYGFIINDGVHRVYYSGDGGYSDSFKEIGKQHDVDLAFMECGQYDVRWPYCHMFPEETAQAAFDVRAKYFVPVHWGAFCLCNSAWNDSPKRASIIAKELNIKMITPRIGEKVKYPEIESFVEEWWNV